MVRIMKMFKAKRKNGFAMVMFVVLLPLMLGFMGISIDGGNLMFNNFKLRTSCRLAALTGGSDSYSDGKGRYVITDISRAKKLATNNFWLNMSGKKGMTVPGVYPSISATSKSIRVKASMRVEFFFIPVIGGPNSTVINEYYDVNVN